MRYSDYDFLVFPTQGDLPPNLRQFLEMDGQGMDGLEFMLSHYELAKRIPKDVRLEYEALYGALSIQLEEKIAEWRKTLDAIEKNPRDAIHNAIQTTLEQQKD